MIRVFVVDQHPTVRAGLQTFLDSEPGFVFTGGCVGDEATLWPLLRRLVPDLVLLDCRPRRCDGLQLCYRIKLQVPTLKVILFVADAGVRLHLPAWLAGADGLLDKELGAPQLFEALRRVSRGERLLEAPSAPALGRALARLPEELRALTGLLLDGIPAADAARTLGTTVDEVHRGALDALRALHAAPAAQRN